MKVYKFILFLFFLVITSCNTKEQNQKSKKNVLVPVDSLNFENETLSFDKEFVFSQYYDDLIKKLNEHKVPEFLIDECLDAKEIAYCDLGSHKSCSLRYNLLKKLSLSQLEYIIKLTKVNQLKQICEIDFVKEKLFGKVSTYDLIVSLLSDKSK
jgi:hypothetical protein